MENSLNLQTIIMSRKVCPAIMGVIVMISITNVRIIYLSRITQTEKNAVALILIGLEDRDPATFKYRQAVYAMEL